MPRSRLVPVPRPIVLANQVHLALGHIAPSASAIAVVVVIAIVVVPMLPVFPSVRLGDADADGGASEQHESEH
jgi:hypothetical protein